MYLISKMRNFLSIIFKKNFFIPLNIFILFFCLNVIFQINGYDENSYLSSRHKRQVKKVCSEDQFSCANGKCVNSAVICDGNKDCEDGSDETAQLCENTNCPQYGFRCSYGACIDKNLKCDGNTDCADGSDEVNSDCPARNGKCSSNEAECKSGQCISSFSMCDGAKDCDDGSDETFEACRNMPCPTYSFRCDYGACIDAKYRCDKKSECVDGSDESPKLCRIATTMPSANTAKPVRTSSTSPPAISSTTHRNVETPGSCILPPNSPDKTYRVNCNGETPCHSEPGEFAPKYTELTFKCNEGYFREESNTFLTFCLSGKWNSPMYNCSRTCQKLTGEYTELKCTRKSVPIDCDSTLLAGTEIKPTCMSPYHQQEPVSYSDITCKDDGSWNNPLPKCVPDCGIPASDVTGYIAHGQNARYGDSPWHVAIYNTTDYILICGGTIITQQLVVTAAHCFYNEQKSKKEDPKFYEIVVSKVTIQYKVMDNNFQKAYKIRAIYFDKDYLHKLSYFEDDIALLIISEKIRLSPNVLPACLHWFDYQNIILQDGVLGKVVGWGLKENNVASEKLLTAELPFVSRKTCLQISSEGFKPFIRYDKFCAGTQNVTEAGVRQGDSGGGLLFRDVHSSFYFLRGLVSAGEVGRSGYVSSMAVFTDLNYHMEWIRKIRQEVEK